MTVSPEDSKIERAACLLKAAYEKQLGGELETAIDLYKASIAEHPTAEAHTFLGWTYSFQGRLDEAIQECKTAIGVDPSFGNPYNDIGSYLVHQNRLEEAIPWLEKAKLAPRYEPRHFPYLNLGKIYLRLGRIREANREFEQAAFFQSALESLDHPDEDSDVQVQ
jgi:Tfp pilus assembly protein PilF